MTDDKSPVFIDANILVRANIQSALLHEQALNLIKQLRQNNREIWISRQVLREYMAVVTRPQTFMSPLPIKNVTERVRYFQSSFRVAEDNPAMTEKLLELIEHIPTGGKQIHDANIAATMIVQGIKQLLTYNVGDFVRFSGYITVISPETLTEKSDNEQE